MILIMKLNYKVTPISIVEEVDGKRFIKFVNRQSLPPKTSAVEEAIIINVDKNTVSLIEKRFQNKMENQATILMNNILKVNLN